MQPLSRRTWLGRVPLVTLLPPMLLAGCGFALRETPKMPFSRILLTGFAPRSPMETELRARLAEVVTVVETPAQAEVTLQALSDRRERSVVATTSAGQVRELQFRISFKFRLLAVGGRELIPPTELPGLRDMSYRETAALGKSQEEGELFAAMQTDLVHQVLTRLARIDVPATAPARASLAASAAPAPGASAPRR